MMGMLDLPANLFSIIARTAHTNYDNLVFNNKNISSKLSGATVQLVNSLVKVGDIFL